MAPKQINPKIAIAVPNLNQGRYLLDALESIRRQEGIDIYVAVLDAGSTDNSLEIIRENIDIIQYWRSHKDEGQAAAINEGIAAFPRVDYVCWLNADDTFLTNGLSKMAEFLEKNKQYVAVYGKAHITNEINQKIGEYPTEPFSRETLAMRCIICQPATLVRADIWQKVKGVDSRYHMCMDYELWWRIAAQGDIAYFEYPVACSRDHDETKTRNNQKAHFEEAFELLRNHYGQVPWHWCISRVKEIIHPSGSLYGKLFQRILASILYLKMRKGKRG
ncbi:glycosyltransferase [Paenibacillus antri]|uniref:Glycosyltransferase n=1 Tax=Paenibacillus antri TaxID=2582848 RepID=A0A5R9G8H4_9BACL|nr:glycosyltransferase [Paenibacillus antri]TLS52021.1 glycosyltransferase [Paenibacillus antri]